MTRTDTFKQALKELLAKYEVQLTSYDDYDGEENYCGTDYAFTGTDVYLGIDRELEKELQR
jgi:hypothetical protein